MRKISEIQDELLEITKKFHILCKENDIKYTLFGGTLIGAIREKGFIPWDDDVDVAMERQEYEKFLSVLPEEFDIIYEYWIPRLVYKGAKHLNGGQYMDIFILDKAPGSKSRHQLKVLQLKFLQGMMKEKAHINLRDYDWKGKIASLITYICGKLITAPVKRRLYETIARKDRTEDTNYVSSYTDQFQFVHFRYHKDIISGYKEVRFENLELMIMQGYDAYLTMAYGDYMTPPPKEKRIPKHGHGKL